MLDPIIEKLKEIDENVQKNIVRKEDTASWDCLAVIKRRIRSRNTGKSKSTHVDVVIAREDEIEDGMVDRVIEAMSEIGWRLASEDDIEFDHPVDSNEIVVEVCTIHFFAPEKRC